MPKNYSAIIENPSGTGGECILIVCPPSHDQQGAKMSATINAIRAGGYHLRHLYLADALDQHNGGSLERALARGDDWLARHATLIGAVPLTRWQDIRNAENFTAKYAEIRRLYGEDDISRLAVDEICLRHTKTLLARFAARGIMADAEPVMKACVRYMLEEIAGLSVIRSITDAPEIYPGEYFADSEIFTRRARLNLSLPAVLPVKFRENTPFQKAV